MVNNSSIHKSTNVTETVKNEIEIELNNKNYVINDFEISSEIIERYGKISIFTVLSIRYLKDEQVFDFKYSTQDPVTEESNFLIRIIKVAEEKALKNYKNKTVEENDFVPQLVNLNQCKTKKFESSNFNVEVSCKMNEIINFLTQNNFIQYWAGSSFKYDNGRINFENIEMEILKVENDFIMLNYKWNDWNEFCIVKINLEQLNSTVNLKFTIDNIPVGFSDNVKSHWQNKIFGPIGALFNFRIKI